MVRGRTPQSTMADRKGSAARLASYRDGGLSITKFAGKGHWEAHLAGDELIHLLDGAATLEIVCDDGPPKSFALSAGMIAVNPQGAWHRFQSSEGVTLMAAPPVCPARLSSSMSTTRGTQSASRHERRARRAVNIHDLGAKQCGITAARLAALDPLRDDAA